MGIQLIKQRRSLFHCNTFLGFQVQGSVSHGCIKADRERVAEWRESSCTPIIIRDKKWNANSDPSAKSTGQEEEWDGTDRPTNTGRIVVSVTCQS